MQRLLTITFWHALAKPFCVKECRRAISKRISTSDMSGHHVPRQVLREVLNPLALVTLSNLCVDCCSCMCRVEGSLKSLFNARHGEIHFPSSLRKPANSVNQVWISGRTPVDNGNLHNPSQIPVRFSCNPSTQYATQYSRTLILQGWNSSARGGGDGTSDITCLEALAPPV